MLILVGHATTPDKLKLITSAAGDVDTYVSYIDCTDASPPVPKAPNKQATNITTAATTDILAGTTTATDRRNVKQVTIRNVSATVTNDVTVVIDAIDGSDYELHKVSLAPGEMLEYHEGVGWFEIAASAVAIAGATNKLTGSDQALGTTDVYLTNSNLTLAAFGAPVIGRAYHWRFVVSKTGAGTATPIIQVRVGTAGAIGDTSRLTFTWGAGTAAVDRVEIELDALFVVVGASAILRGKANVTSNLTTTGWSNAVKALQPADSGAFSSTVANDIIGLSYNAGTAGAHTLEYLTAFTDNF